MKTSTYSDKENGKTEITLSELYRIADGLETTVAYLLGIEESSIQNNNATVVLTQNNSGTIYFQPSQEMVEKLVGGKK
jgi:transcriptional regulator with XRE-family HTH domain